MTLMTPSTHMGLVNCEGQGLHGSSFQHVRERDWITIYMHTSPSSNIKAMKYYATWRLLLLINVKNLELVYSRSMRWIGNKPIEGVSCFICWMDERYSCIRYSPLSHFKGDVNGTRYVEGLPGLIVIVVGGTFRSCWANMGQGSLMIWW